MIEPYYSDDAVTLYHGDFREILPELDLSIDLLIADPPYGETRLGWDTWPDGWPSIAAAHANSMWCFGSMRMFLDRRDEFAEWKLSQDIVWEKHNGSSMKSDRFNRVHEHALFWYRGRWDGIHHETPTVPEASVRRVRRQARPAHWIGAQGENSYASIEGGPLLLQRSVIYSRSMHGRAINETEKPVPVVEPLLTYGCPGGGLVVDVFSGSGVTGAAAKATGRRAVLFETREQQCEASANRLAGLLDFGGVTA